MNKFTLALHGGAGTILKSEMDPEREKNYTVALQEALSIGTNILAQGGSSLDAVTETVVYLENNPLFNAGKGSVYTHRGVQEMDAAIMKGDTLEAGTVAGVRNIRNPIHLARKIMEESGHVFLSGKGASEFALKMHLPFESDEYFFDPLRYQQWMAAKNTDQYVLDHISEKKFGTVGAVAMDSKGNLAAATSTGGMTNKRFGRVGDSPVIGAGTYANNKTCAISCTGHGEYFMRAVVSYDISCLIEYKNYSLEQACNEVVKNKLVAMGGEGGLIAVDNKSNISLCFNSEGMYRASQKEGEMPYIGIYA